MDDLIQVVNQWQYVVDTFLGLHIFATIAFGSRLWTKSIIVGKAGADDWLLLATWITMTIACGYTLYMSDMMAELFSADGMPSVQFNQFIKFDTFAYILSMTLVKLSLGLFLIRAFATHRGQKALTYIVTGTTFFSGFANGMFTLLTCGSSSGFFGTGLNCTVSEAYSAISAVWSLLDVIGNVGLTMLAVNALVLTRLPCRAVFITSIPLSFGAASCVAAVLRLVIMCNTETELSYLASINLGICTVVEMGAAMTALSLAGTLPLLDKVFNKTVDVRQSALEAGESGPASTEMMVVDQQTGLPELDGGEVVQVVHVNVLTKDEENARPR
ncbi:hypothetical protein K461DRAFT_264233 [Myriangium duriaei CBS 260.36]|uniref:Rhodopsin domain-containing protein n=1 Tax=Myriangium duriaei CBS 260.36 TaxID=1168546 RepID=A0A9P4MS99_9PEZI|nr:hypothetical protein K461DRAFT_264233 [Myriangium duriaei CBS 260.36]